MDRRTLLKRIGAATAVTIGTGTAAASTPAEPDETACIVCKDGTCPDGCADCTKIDCSV